MSGNIFLISDTHFGHKGILEFNAKRGEGKERPFASVEEMDEFMIEKWNSVVGPQDKVYHLGDVCIPRKGLKHLARCNGKKRLIKGNHDIFRVREYAEYFEDIRAYHTLEKFVLSHIPLHPTFVEERWKGNIHGHLHSESVTKTVLDGSWYGMHTEIDPLYLCVSVEQINYTPISFEEAKKRFEEQQ